MKKEDICIPILNKKQSKKIKTILKVLDEKIDNDYWINKHYTDIKTELYFYNGKWRINDNIEILKKITIKQLIKLLISEDKSIVIDEIENVEPFITNVYDFHNI